MGQLLAGAATKLAAGAAKGAAAKGAAGAAAKGAATKGASGALGKVGQAFGKIQEFSRPGGAARQLGELLGNDSPIGKGLTAFGDSFDPLNGQFNAGALFDDKQRTELRDKREIIEALFAELGQRRDG